MYDTIVFVSPAKGAIGSIMRGPDEDAAARPVETPERGRPARARMARKNKNTKNEGIYTAEDGQGVRYDDAFDTEQPKNKKSTKVACGVTSSTQNN